MQMSVPLAKWIILKQRSRRVPGNTERLNRATTSISTRTCSNADFRILNFGTCTRPRMAPALHCTSATMTPASIATLRIERKEIACLLNPTVGYGVILVVDTCKRKQAWRRRHCRERTIRSSGVWPDLHFIGTVCSHQYTGADKAGADAGGVRAVPRIYGGIRE